LLVQKDHLETDNMNRYIVVIAVIILVIVLVNKFKKSETVLLPVTERKIVSNRATMTFGKGVQNTPTSDVLSQEVADEKVKQEAEKLKEAIKQNDIAQKAKAAAQKIADKAKELLGKLKRKKKR